MTERDKSIDGATRELPEHASQAEGIRTTAEQDLEQLFGRFSPHGSLIAVFDRAKDRESAQRAIRELGIADVRAVSDREVLLQRAVGERRDDATEPAGGSIGEYLDEASDGQSFLVVHLIDSDQLELARETLLRNHAHRVRAIQPDDSWAAGLAG